jgi:hypothetical protein
MTESPADGPDDEQSKDDVPAEEQSSDPTGDSEVGPAEALGEGGYRGRDPETDMPRVPTAPETQDDE